MTSPKVAYITGAASGVGATVTRLLHARGYTLILTDRNIEAANRIASDLEPQNANHAVLEIDVASWDSQVAAFSKAIEPFGKVDIVVANAGIGERVFVPNDGGKGSGFVKPDLAVLDIDLTGVMYTAALAVQQMRRQSIGEDSLRGKIITTASVCGFYCVPTLPVYTAAKHGVVGFVRSYGKYLPEENITLNAVCPHVVRTGISTEAYYDTVDAKGLLTPMPSVMNAFEQCLDTDMSGECLEVGPAGLYQVRKAPAVANKESAELNELLYQRGHPLHEVKE